VVSVGERRLLVQQSLKHGVQAALAVVCVAVVTDYQAIAVLILKKQLQLTHRAEYADALDFRGMHTNYALVVAATQLAYAG
jgi:hypothetical protein